MKRILSIYYHRMIRHVKFCEDVIRFREVIALRLYQILINLKLNRLSNEAYSSYLFLIFITN